MSEVAIFKSVRCGPPPPEACLMRIEQGVQQGLHAQALLSDRIEQLEFTLTHYIGEEDGVLARLAGIEERLAGLERAQAGRPLTERLDRMADVLATLATRITAAPMAGPAPEPLDSDLDGLPGLGPGLIRMLEKAGLRRIEELACADATLLREALGPVGDVLDTGFLVNRARAAMAEAQADLDMSRAAQEARDLTDDGAGFAQEDTDEMRAAM